MTGVYYSSKGERIAIDTMAYKHVAAAIKAIADNPERMEEFDALTARLKFLDDTTPEEEPQQSVARIPNGSHVAPPRSEASSILAVIERIAANPNADIDKLERLLAMQERIMERQAKAAYFNALRTVKRLLPVIDANGRIEIKDRNGNVIQSTPYGLYEDIDAIVTPILDDHGLVLSFRTATAPDGRLMVTGVLNHMDGHEETAPLTLPFDSSGSKNGVQAVGSSLSYGQRYALKALTNFVVRGEDDDGETGGRLPSAHLAKQGPMGERCAALANEIKELESVEVGLAWGQSHAAEINTFPKRWQDMLRDDLRAHISFLREQTA